MLRFLRKNCLAFILLGFACVSNAASSQPPIVFVSFSMPEASLRALKVQSEDVGAVLIFRGFHRNSLKRTVAEIQRIFELKASDKTTIQINPLLFSEYNIEQVPCVVHEAKKICGNVPLITALEKIQGG